MANNEVEKKENKKTKGVLTQADIDAWKATYDHVYKTYSNNQAIIYRPIKRSEYTRLMLDTDIDPADEQDTEKRMERLSSRQVGICKISILYPPEEEADKLLEDEAGLASNLADVIMDHSGFNALANSEEL
jgi:hypothetical protein